MLYRRECNVQRKESWPGKYGDLKTSLCRRVQAMVQVSLKTFLYFMILVTTRGVKFFETCYFLGQPLTLWTQSTSSMIQRSPDADVSQIWIWMSPGKKNPAKSLAMCIVLKRGLLHPKTSPNHQQIGRVSKLCKAGDSLGSHCSRLLGIVFWHLYDM